MHLRIATVFCALSILIVVATAQPAAETPRTERRPITGGYQPRAGKNIGRAGDPPPVPPPSMFSPSSGENAAEPEISESAVAMVPTRSSFIANWQKVNEATG